ncbi:hypothetical protein [Streptomyces sp. NPDC050564]|uniref:hypothetical protein n=1 Tax=Streptomyces sp. NPDC050564 TaxID=3365631 RepID=UPI003796971A
MNADQFNAAYPVGTPVLAYPFVRPEHPVAVRYREAVEAGRAARSEKDPCMRLVTVTRTPAWELGHGEPVVSVDGYAGGICLTHIDVIEDAVQPITDTATAVRELGALPMPTGGALMNSTVIPLPSSWACAYGATDDEPFCTEVGDEHVCPTIRVHRDDTEQFAALVARVHELESQVEKVEGQRPNRYRATPAEVDWFLRKVLTEETLLNYQRAIGNRAVEEAAEDIRQETARLKAHGVLEPDKDWAAATAADWIDTSKDGGHYPSQLLCAKHDGFNPCPGAPRCTPRDDEEAAR